MRKYRTYMFIVSDKVNMLPGIAIMTQGGRSAGEVSHILNFGTVL
jgi:hypothetical protein